MSFLPSLSSLTGLGNVVAAPGRALQSVAQSVGDAIDRADRKFEGSALGNNVLGHLLGGAAQVVVSTPAAVANVVGATFDGHLFRGALKAAMHPVATVERLGTQIKDDFRERPAHSLGALAVMVTGAGTGLSTAERAAARAEARPALAELRHGTRVKQAAALERKDFPAVLKLQVDHLETKSGIARAARNAQMQGSLALGSRFSQAIQYATRPVFNAVEKVPVPDILKMGVTVPVQWVRDGARYAEHAANSPVGRAGMTSAVTPPEETRVRGGTGNFARVPSGERSSK